MLTTQDPVPAPARTHPHDVGIHDLFMDQAARTPHAVALADGPDCWTYSELDLLTNRMARHLRSRGIGPEVVVGCFVRSPAVMVIHILAVLKAGGAYLLLDRNLPAARLRYMVTDAAPAIVIHDEALPLLVSRRALATLSLADLATAAAQESPAPVGGRTDGNQAAYLAYTSGSTGRPKGVVITHAATVAHTRAFTALFDLDGNDRVPLMAPAAFDMATEEIVPALLAGCQLIASTSTHDDMAALTAEITARGYTILNIPAPLWQRWTEHLQDTGQAVPRGVRLLITGSDRIYTSTLREWLQLPGADAVQWVAAYGVTEATVTSSFYLGAAVDDLSQEPLVPIGQPIAGTCFHILDEDGRPVPTGTVGELMIGGWGLARGYVNLPQLTRQKFVADPFSTRDGARLYRTGDLARQLPDGTTVWVGRQDAQVKLQGLRVELGEVESVLAEHPAISAAVLAVRPVAGTAAGEQLVAYVVSRPGRVLDLDRLGDYLGARVHPLMVPHRFELLRRIPLTPSGKLDRLGLPGTNDPGASHDTIPDPRPAPEAAAGTSAPHLRVVAMATPSSHAVPTAEET